MEERLTVTGRSHSSNPSLSFSKPQLPRIRKSSFMRTSRIGSLVYLQRTLFGIGIKQRYANTYRLESMHPFNNDKVTTIIKDVLETELSPLEKYDPEICKRLCIQMAQEIRSRVRILDYDRYRIVTRVNIVEKLKQGIHISTCFLWDPERDLFVSYPYENSFLRAVGTVYGIYCE